MSIADQRLRLELLRSRAAIERVELAAAVDDLREHTLPLLRLVGLASRVSSIVGAGSRLSSPRGWLSLALTALDQKPWVGLLLAGALRVARRRPLAAALALGAIAAAALARRATQGSAAGSAAAAASPVTADAETERD
jgi:hypothetical protein